MVYFLLQLNTQHTLNGVFLELEIRLVVADSEPESAEGVGQSELKTFKVASTVIKFNRYKKPKSSNLIDISLELVL